MPARWRWVTLASPMPSVLRIPRILRPWLGSLALVAALAGAAPAHDDIVDALHALADSTRTPGPEAMRACAAAEWLRADGRLAAADSALRVAEALDPRVPEIRAARAALALDEGRPQEALAALEPLLAALPGFAEARWLRARARVALGDRAAALADFDRALADTRRPTPEAYAERADVTLAAGDTARALAGLDAGFTRLHAVGLAERATRLEAALGEVDLALARLAPLAALDPSLRAARARLLTAAGRKLEADAEWTVLIEALRASARRTASLRALVLEAEAALAQGDLK